jgi:hypothetical protein
MIGAVFHFAAFVVLAIGLILSAALFTGLAVVVAASGTPRTRQRRDRPARIFAMTPRFDLAIDR